MLSPPDKHTHSHHCVTLPNSFFSKLQFSLFRAAAELAAYHALVQRKLPALARPHTGRGRARDPPPSPPTPATPD